MLDAKGIKEKKDVPLSLRLLDTGMLKFLLIPLLLATAEYDEAPMRPGVTTATKEPAYYAEGPQHVSNNIPKNLEKGPPGPKNPTTKRSAYGEGPPMTALSS